MCAHLADTELLTRSLMPWDISRHRYAQFCKKRELTAQEFFMSAIALANSLKCISGQYGIGWTKSPDDNPARTVASSQSSLFVTIAPW